MVCAVESPFNTCPKAFNLVCMDLDLLYHLSLVSNDMVRHVSTQSLIRSEPICYHTSSRKHTVDVRIRSIIDGVGGVAIGPCRDRWLVRLKWVIIKVGRIISTFDFRVLHSSDDLRFFVPVRIIAIRFDFRFVIFGEVRDSDQNAVYDFAALVDTVNLNKKTPGNCNQHYPACNTDLEAQLTLLIQVPLESLQRFRSDPPVYTVPDARLRFDLDSINFLAHRYTF